MRGAVVALVSDGRQSRCRIARRYEGLGAALGRRPRHEGKRVAVSVSALRDESGRAIPSVRRHCVRCPKKRFTPSIIEGFVSSFSISTKKGSTKDHFAGVEDGNGSAWHDPSHSQFDWIVEVLAAEPRPRATFVFGHVALRAASYNYDPPDPRWACPGPPNWSKHNRRFRTQALLKRLAASGVTAYFHGHDHVPSRLLLAADGRVLRDGRFGQTAQSFPSVAFATERLAARRLWQLDAGRVARRAVSCMCVSAVWAWILRSTATARPITTTRATRCRRQGWCCGMPGRWRSIRTKRPSVPLSRGVDASARRSPRSLRACGGAAASRAAARRVTRRQRARADRRAGAARARRRWGGR